jgi:hypothetical protein
MTDANDEPGRMINKKSPQLEYTLTGQGLWENGNLGRGR